MSAAEQIINNVFNPKSLVDIIRTMSHPDLFARNPSLMTELKNQERQFRSLNDNGRSMGSILQLPSESIVSESFRVISMPQQSIQSNGQTHLDQQPRSAGNSLTIQEEQKIINCLTASQSNSAATSQMNGAMSQSHSNTTMKEATDNVNQDKEGVSRKESTGSQSSPYLPLLNSWSSTSSDVATAEMFLKELRVENERLKEVVLSNSESMKKQLKIVQSWQQEVMEARKSCADTKKESKLSSERIKLLEATVKALEKENNALRERVFNLTEGREGHERVYPTLESQSSLSGHDNAAPPSGLQSTFDQLYGHNQSSKGASVVEEVNPSLTMKSMNAGKSLGDYYWDDLSLGLEEMRQKLEKVNFLEQVNGSNKDEIIRLASELSLAQQTITRLQQQLVVTPSAPLAEGMDLEPVREEDEEDESDEDTETTEDSIESQEGVAGKQEEQEGQSSQGQEKRQERREDRKLFREKRKEIKIFNREQKKIGKLLRKRDRHHNHNEGDHSFANCQTSNAQGDNQNVSISSAAGGNVLHLPGSVEIPIPANPRYLRKLLKGRHVANLTNGLKLKAFNHLSS
jgi:hypothetical protein